MKEYTDINKGYTKGVLVDYRTPAVVLKRLSSLGIKVYKTKRCTALYEAVSGHADMVLCRIDKDTFICEPTVFEYYSALFPKLKIIQGSTCITGTYPHDIAYNTARVGEYAICNMEYTDRKILEYFDRFGIKIINVKQGYAKCSVCVVNETSIITADKGIADAARTRGIDALVISPGNIVLPGVNYGFIGGSTGRLSYSCLAVCGNIYTHTDGERIVDFCKSRDVEVLSLSGDNIFDVGTIIPIGNL